MKQYLTLILIIFILFYLIINFKKNKSRKIKENFKSKSNQETSFKDEFKEEYKKDIQNLLDIYQFKELETSNLVSNYENLMDIYSHLEKILESGNQSDELLLKFRNIYKYELEEQNNKLNKEKNNIYNRRYFVNKNKDRNDKMKLIVKIVLAVTIIAILIKSIVNYFSINFNTLE